MQGSWNYRTLIGSGFGFALLPVLRALYGRDRARLDEAIERHTRLMNSHPYLAPLALGAVASLEAGGEDPQLIERFKAALRGSLGTLGDRLVWAGWRPVTLLLALACLWGGVAWWMVVLGFLIVYNAGHVVLRAWAFNVGVREGRGVGERLRRSPLDRVQHHLTAAGAFLAGLAIPLVVVGLPLQMGSARPTVSVLPLPWAVAAIAGALLGARYGGRVRRIVALALAGFTVLGLLLGIIA